MLKSGAVYREVPIHALTFIGDKNTSVTHVEVVSGSGDAKKTGASSLNECRFKNELQCSKS